jgi:hypothetical protein
MTDPAVPDLDLVCLGRINLDLHAEQDGAPLEDVQSFRSDVGGLCDDELVGAVAANHGGYIET